jgi:hypothetical protein
LIRSIALHIAQEFVDYHHQFAHSQRVPTKIGGVIQPRFEACDKGDSASAFCFISRTDFRLTGFF